MTRPPFAPLLLCLGCASAGAAPKGVDAGVQTVGATLSGRIGAGQTLKVVGDAKNVVTVPKGKALIVEPGAVLDFVGNPDVTAADVDGDSVMNHQKGRVELRVYGRIEVRGSASAKAVLTSSNPWGWWGINFFGNESVGDGHPVFEHMLFEKVRKNEYNSSRELSRGAIWAHYLGGPVTLRHSVLRDNEVSGKCGAIDLMYTTGSVIENNVFENNRTKEIDRFAGPGSTSMSGGGAMCITHGRNSVVRGNTFRNNTVESWRGHAGKALTQRGFLEWPNPSNTYDLGGGGALHYMQPDNDLIENNVFEGNQAKLGPGAAIYLEAVGQRGVTLRKNQFKGNTGGTGGVIVCNRGSGKLQLVLEASNTFADNVVNGAPAPNVTGDCSR